VGEVIKDHLYNTSLQTGTCAY